MNKNPSLYIEVFAVKQSILKQNYCAIPVSMHSLIFSLCGKSVVIKVHQYQQVHALTKFQAKPY